MNEEKPEITSAEKNKRAKTRQMLTVYAAVFVGVVLCLLIASYLAQIKEYRSLEDELQIQTEKSTGIASKYDAMLKEVETLKTERNDLMEKNGVYEKNYAALKEYEKTLPQGENPGEKLLAAANREEMLTRLAELYRTYRNGTRGECHKIFDEMEQNNDRSLMTKEEETDYQALKKKVKYVDKPIA